MNACLHLTVLTAADHHPQTRPLWHILAHLHNTLHAMYNQILSIITFSMLIFIFYFEVPLVIPVYKKEQKIFKIKFFLQLFYYFFKTNHYNFLIIKSTPSKCTLFPMNINTVYLFWHFISYFYDMYTIFCSNLMNTHCETFILGWAIQASWATPADCQTAMMFS